MSQPVLLSQPLTDKKKPHPEKRWRVWRWKVYPLKGTLTLNPNPPMGTSQTQPTKGHLELHPTQPTTELSQTQPTKGHPELPQTPPDPTHRRVPWTPTHPDVWWAQPTHLDNRMNPTQTTDEPHPDNWWTYPDNWQACWNHPDHPCTYREEERGLGVHRFCLIAGILPEGVPTEASESENCPWKLCCCEL